MGRTKNYIEQMMLSQNEQLSKLHQIVEEAIQEETLLTNRINEIFPDTKRSFAERLADKVAAFGGSWKFIIVFMLVITAWIILNTVILKKNIIDAYPFILLNLVLSCVAAIQAPIIMMSQNRQEAKDRARAENDYLVNLKAEIEIRNLHRKMDLSMIDQFQHLCKIQEEQLEILERIEKQVLKNDLPV